MGLNEVAAVAFRNRLINGNFSVNQRCATDAPFAYKPSDFIRDRWRAGIGGCTAACVKNSNGDTTIHIGSGSIVQIIEGERYLPEGGSYCLSWHGNAVGRAMPLGGKSAVFESCPVVLDRMPPGRDVVVEFSIPAGSSPVSVSLAQIEPGTKSTVFERRDDEIDRCHRYFRRLNDPALRGVLHTSKLAARCGMILAPPMRTKPALNLIGELYVFDGSKVSVVASIASNYSTTEIIEVDLSLSAELTAGRPAVMYVADQGGSIDVSAEL
ncbi:hypothetical protein [Methylobacterium sp. D48H]